MMLRYAGADRYAQGGRWGIALLTVAVTGGLCAAAVHHGCYHPPPPVIVPDPGTPRATYCSALIPAKPWIMLVLAPCVFVLLIGMVARTQRVLGLCTLLMCMILIGNAIAANSLNAALTV